MAVLTEQEKKARQQAATSRTSPAAFSGTVSRPSAYAPAPVRVTVDPLKTPGGALPRTAPAPRPMGQRGSRPVRMARELSWRSPMLVATLIASFVVSLLCLYVHAYATVNDERKELSRLRERLREAQRQELDLNARISVQQLSVPQRANAMGLQPAPPEASFMLTPEANGVVPAGVSAGMPITSAVP